MQLTVTQKAAKLKSAEDDLVYIYTTAKFAHVVRSCAITFSQFAEQIYNKQNNKKVNTVKLKELTLALSVALNLMSKNEMLALK